MNYIELEDIRSEFEYIVDGLENFSNFLGRLEEIEDEKEREKEFIKDFSKKYIKILENRRDSMNRIIENLKEDTKEINS